MHDLGTLGGSYSNGLGINDSGHVVGISETTGGSYHAFLTVSGGGMYDLNSLIDPGSGWELTHGFGINSSGQITGMGLHNGQGRAFLLTSDGSPLPPGTSSTVPEPASLTICGGIGLVGLIVGWRRRK